MMALRPNEISILISRKCLTILVKYQEKTHICHNSHAKKSHIIFYSAQYNTNAWNQGLLEQYYRNHAWNAWMPWNHRTMNYTRVIVVQLEC